MKRLLALILCATMAFCLCGCDTLSGNIESLLSPPAPSGVLKDVQAALNKSVNYAYTLKYPTSGEHRSAIVLKDLDGDGDNEALAFYSTTLDNTTNMHVNYITMSDDGWVSKGQSSIVASGVEKIDFADLDGDGILEVIVGWSVYGSVEKHLSVYALHNGTIVSRIQESYTSYLYRDFNGDSTPDILIIYQDTANSVSTAKLLDLTDEGATEIGSCPLDPAVSEYKEPVVFHLSGRTAVYIDGIKGAGTITEMLLVDSKLINLSYTEGTNTAFNTFRTGNAPIADVNSDGNYDIPISYLLTASLSGAADNIYKTNWYCFNGTEIIMSLSVISNTADGYYLEIPEKWDSSITVTGNTAEHLRTVYRLDKITGTSAEELLKIQAIPKSAGLTPTYEGSFKLAENDKFTYFAALGSYTGVEAITKDELKDMFLMIN